MDYIPQTQQAPLPATTYELKTDVTGKPPPKRDAVILTLPTGQKAKVPHAPNPNCRKCKGRGYMGRDIKSGNILFCRKCYNE
jgi:hypothetical protein